MISVCMATFNGEKYILEQLHSILLQLGKDDEVIISDDSSTDGTIKLINSIADSRIKVFPNQNFHNPTLNFQNAITKSNGDIIFLADQDDYWFSKKVSVMVDYLSMYDLVVSDCQIGDENLKVVLNSHFEWRHSKSGLFKNLYKNSYLGCCIAFNRKILTKALPFPSYIPMFDTWIGLISDIYFKTYFIPEKLMIYRRHSNNVTKFTSDFKSVNSYYLRIKNRLLFGLALISRVFKF